MAAGVAVLLDDVVLVCRHVLGVARKDDQVVERGEVAARADLVEILLGEDVGRQPRPRHPDEERKLVAVDPRRHAEICERPGERDAEIAASGVPGVAPAVAVSVVEVVRLPRVRREHDRDAARGPERSRPDDEGRVADAAVAGVELREVEAARPVADGQADRGRRVRVARPVDLLGVRDRRPCELVGRGRRPGARRVVEPKREGRRIGRHPQQRRVSGRVALAREARLDAEDTDDRGGEVAPGVGSLGAVRAPVPRRVDRGQEQEVGAGRGVGRRRPEERAPPGGERGDLRRDDRPAPLRLLDAEDDAGRLRQREGDAGGVAALRAERRQHRSVARERVPAVRRAEVEQPRRGGVAACRRRVMRREEDEQHGGHAQHRPDVSVGS